WRAYHRTRIYSPPAPHVTVGVRNVGLTRRSSWCINFESLAVYRLRVETNTFPSKLHVGNRC
ncbi:hypothetical protein, partial [Microcoleus sp. S13_B4]|uniref:hypothetical protein n=1 Tax=Microcoleus sp. S13_B4 TaxID=3055408 RepID=UPI002FD3A6F9